MISFGGLFTVGGGTLVCTSCSHSWLHHIGGLIRMRDLLAAGPLAATPFRPTGMVLGGAISSNGRQLCELLGVSIPTDDVEETCLRIEGGPSLSMRLHFEKVRAGAEDPVDATVETGGSASQAHLPINVGCIRHVDERRDSQLKKRKIDRVAAHDRKSLSSFAENLKNGIKFEDMDDELKSW